MTCKIKIIIVVILLIQNIQMLMNQNLDLQYLTMPEMEQALINKLFHSYNKKLKPAGTVEIKFALNLNQIVNLIEKEQIIILNVFLDHEWIDNRLKWNPAEHNNITLLRISCEQVWTPDTFVYTTADQSGFLMPQAGTYFIVQHEGIIFWPNPLTQMKLRCRMSITYFPYDQQLCVIIFGSWSHTSAYLNYTLITEIPSLQNYTENNEWRLIDYKPYRLETKYENWVENDSFAEINYKILIQRKPLFVVHNFVAPALMLCILTLVSFFIPFAQEMQIGISILLSFAVFKLR
jgi:nicotinic acetylcholine receptor, invertebrate